MKFIKRWRIGHLFFGSKLGMTRRSQEFKAHNEKIREYSLMMWRHKRYAVATTNVA
jgi:hypothetical protein